MIACLLFAFDLPFCYYFLGSSSEKERNRKFIAHFPPSNVAVFLIYGAPTSQRTQYTPTTEPPKWYISTTSATGILPKCSATSLSGSPSSKENGRSTGKEAPLLTAFSAGQPSIYSLPLSEHARVISSRSLSCWPFVGRFPPTVIDFVSTAQTSSCGSPRNRYVSAI